MTKTEMSMEQIHPLPLNSVDRSQPLRHKRSQQKNQPVSVSRKQTRRAQPELFPNQTRNSTLPSKGTENVDFNKNCWSSTTPQVIQAEPGRNARRALPTPIFEAVDQDPLLHLPKVSGYYIAQVVGKTYELHLIIQQQQLEVFKVTQEGIQKLRDEQIQLVQDQIKNQEINAKWAYWSNALEYFGIAANAALGSGALVSGDISLGIQMISGSALSLLGKFARSRPEHKHKGAALSLAGMLLAAHGVQGHLGTVFSNTLPQHLATSLTRMQKLSEVYVSYHQSQSQASFFNNRAKQGTNAFKRKVADKEMEQIIGGFGKKDDAQVVAAASRTINVETQITGDIARGGHN